MENKKLGSLIFLEIGEIFFCHQILPLATSDGSCVLRDGVYIRGTRVLMIRAITTEHEMRSKLTLEGFIAPSLSASTAARVTKDFEARPDAVVLLRRPPVIEARFAPTMGTAQELRAKVIVNVFKQSEWREERGTKLGSFQTWPGTSCLDYHGIKNKNSVQHDYNACL